MAVSRELHRACVDVGYDFASALLVDPSGLQEIERPGFTGNEEDALKILTKERDRWKDEGWIAAADFLTRFINKSQKNGELYEPAGEVKDDIVEQSESMVKQVVISEISRELIKRQELARKWGIGAPGSGPLNELKWSGHVRWQSRISENWKGALYYNSKDDKYLSTNNDLFYAFAGADLTIDVSLKGTKYHKRVFPGPYTTYNIGVKVTIQDDYTFPPVPDRLKIPEYAAANYLETKGYKKFPIKVQFDKSYELTTDTISQRGIAYR